MEKLKTLLIADRGEVAVRIARTCKSLGVKSVALYTSADASSSHVAAADAAVLLPDPPSTAYADGARVLAVAKEHRVDAVMPGCGPLAEDAAFARAVRDAGLGFVGPGADAVQAFATKHGARERAQAAGLPVVPGSKGLVKDVDEAAKVADGVWYPVVLKATAGKDGVGMAVCEDEAQLRARFGQVAESGLTRWGDAGVLVEKLVQDARHIEIEVFGNGMGKAVHFGERECSIQRGFRKVIEECPSPCVERYQGLRDALGAGAVALVEAVNYGSAGAVELLLDNMSGECYFLEMSTRLQVEHGVTELCYDIDLVELMLQQADAELQGKGGLSADHLEKTSKAHATPKGAAIETRVYAENPIRDYAPSRGVLQQVEWPTQPGLRIDTWVSTGTEITESHDLLIAKVMFHASSRQDAIKGMLEALGKSIVRGPPTNLEYLAAILEDPAFGAGNTLTKFLSSFAITPSVIDVISGGVETLIQDGSGRPAIGNGVPHSGAMDPLALQVANALVGNPKNKEGLEIFFEGPELLFYRPAVLALCGAPIEAAIDEEAMPMWSRVHIGAGQKLKLGKMTGGGCRAYLAVYGGFPNVAEFSGSKSTSPSVRIGGCQGRGLEAGDQLVVTSEIKEKLEEGVQLHESVVPQYPAEWEIMATSGPHEEGHLLREDVDIQYGVAWIVSGDVSRTGIKLIGPEPVWAKPEGISTGSHPSNVIQHGYPIGSLTWSGNSASILAVDGPNLGGSVSSLTVIRAHWWKMGQLKPGDKVRFRRVSYDDAVAARRSLDEYVDSVVKAARKETKFDTLKDFEIESAVSSTPSREPAIISQIGPKPKRPLVTYRQGGDGFVIVEYGTEALDLSHRVRVAKLEQSLGGSQTPKSIKSGIINTVACPASLAIAFNPDIVSRSHLLSHLKSLESDLGDLSKTKLHNRVFKLPICFGSDASDTSTNAPVPSSSNGTSPTNEPIQSHFLESPFIVLALGPHPGGPVLYPTSASSASLAAHLQTTSQPLRPLPAGSIVPLPDASTISILTQPTTTTAPSLRVATIPPFDAFARPKGLTPSRPWLLRALDAVRFYRVQRAELDALTAAWRAGRWEVEAEESVFDLSLLVDGGGGGGGVQAETGSAEGGA